MLKEGERVRIVRCRIGSYRHYIGRIGTIRGVHANKDARSGYFVVVAFATGRVVAFEVDEVEAV